MSTNTATADGSDEPSASGEGTGTMMRSSVVMAVGTMVSRLTGFVKAIVIAAALGTQLLGDAYNTAQTIPFIINDLLIGGLIASVIVPLLVKRRKRDSDGGVQTEDRLFTSAVVLLFAITALAILAAEPITRLYLGDTHSTQAEVSVYLARFLLAQIFFVGLSGLISGMLNTRGKFGAPVWAPVLNNLVIIAVGLLFLWVAGAGRTVETVTESELVLLGAGTSAGMALQTVVLLVSLWRTGFRWRPRLDLRGSGLGEALRTAGWMFLYTCMTQIGFLITANIVNRAGAESIRQGHDVGAGLTAYNYAYLLFQLPYAIIAVSVITALLPRMSAHVADGRKDLVRSDFSRGFRLSSVLIVPISVAMVVFAIPFCVLIYARGSTSVEDAQSIGLILMVFSLMLIPFTLFQLLMRVYYALGDTKTPSMIALPAEIAHASLAFSLLFFAPAQLIVVLLPIAYGSYYILGSVLAWRGLRARMGGLDGRRVLRTLVLLHVSAIPSAVFGIAMILTFGLLPGTVISSLLSIIMGGLIGGVLFILVAQRLGVTEVTTFLEMVRSRLLRR